MAEATEVKDPSVVRVEPLVSLKGSFPAATNVRSKDVSIGSSIFLDVVRTRKAIESDTDPVAIRLQLKKGNVLGTKGQKSEIKSESR